MDVYVLGNELVEQDAAAPALKEDLQQRFSEITFHAFDPSEEFPTCDHLILLDTIINASDVVELDESAIDKLDAPGTTSVHDFDLGMTLKLMKKLGKVKRVTIIGVPPLTAIDREEAVEKVSRILSRNLGN